MSSVFQYTKQTLYVFSVWCFNSKKEQKEKGKYSHNQLGLWNYYWISYRIEYLLLWKNNGFGGRKKSEVIFTQNAPRIFSWCMNYSQTGCNLDPLCHKTIHCKKCFSIAVDLTLSRILGRHPVCKDSWFLTGLVYQGEMCELLYFPHK